MELATKCGKLDLRLSFKLQFSQMEFPLHTDGVWAHVDNPQFKCWGGGKNMSPFQVVGSSLKACMI